MTVSEYRYCLAPNSVSKNASQTSENPASVGFFFGCDRCQISVDETVRFQDTDQEIREQVEETIDEFLSCDSIEDLTHGIEANELMFEIPNRWQQENNGNYRWGQSDLNDV